jgi:hypothetical protein
MAPRPDVLDFYRRQHRMTEPGAHAGRIAALPADPAALANALQGLILHEHWSGAYGQTLSDERRSEVHLRGVRAMVDRMLTHDPAPLGQARRLEDRLIGNCRDFTLFTVAALRAHGVPARGRCGFAIYFGPRQRVDHWVAEYWRAGEGRWVMQDSQIDGLQAGHIKPDFDVLDTPPSRFLTAGAAWRACRSGEDDPADFGIMHMHGLWFIAGNLIRDAASLAGCEMLPWDSWGAMPGPDVVIDEQALAWFDHLAELTADPDAAFDEIAALNGNDPRQVVPPVVFNAVRGQTEPV